MNTAQFIKDVSQYFRGKAELYKVNPPMEYSTGEYDSNDDEIMKHTSYVIVSAARIFENETFILPASSDGKVIDWGRLSGSMLDEYNIEKALNNAGYKVIKQHHHNTSII